MTWRDRFVVHEPGEHDLWVPQRSERLVGVEGPTIHPHRARPVRPGKRLHDLRAPWPAHHNAVLARCQDGSIVAEATLHRQILRLDAALAAHGMFDRRGKLRALWLGCQRAWR